MPYIIKNQRKALFMLYNRIPFKHKIKIEKNK